MISPQSLHETLTNLGVEFFAGVPDSLLKHYCAYVSSHVEPSKHVITANEGAAVGLATGYHLVTNSIPMVYLQNSGLGNTINPLLSIAGKEVYSIPMLLMIGWRGEPGVKDEPQHCTQGRVMLSTLDAIEVPYVIIDEISESETVLRTTEAYNLAKETDAPVALIVKKNTFEKYSAKDHAAMPSDMTRERAIQLIAAELNVDTAVVSTTGMASRELFEYRAATGAGHDKDFLTVGGMGHASQIALGIAIGEPSQQVVCIDGDGAAIMHLGSLAISGTSECQNFKHIVINNGAHDSVGGQPTVARNVDLTNIAENCGYKVMKVANTESELSDILPEFLNATGPVLLEVSVNKGNRSDLGRPTTSPAENKANLMQFLNDNKG